MRLTLVNHACVKLVSGKTGVLSDPWLDGTAFNDGWSLLFETPVAIDALMADVTHIWLSHEHPDHFAPKFFSAIAPAYASKVEILFQKTLDGRVRKFCESKGFKVREFEDGETSQVGDFAITIGQMHPYDSWMLARDAEHSVLNLNDCLLHERADLEAMKARAGTVDTLLTQFSYAAWKGGRDNRAFRQDAARQKLDIITAQTRILKPASVIPFASFVYFSHAENSYLNDSVNTPADAARTIAAAGAAPVILLPGDSWEVGASHDNAPALARAAEVFGNIAGQPLVEAGASVPLPELQKRFAAYRERVYKKNSKFLIGLARRVPVAGAFRPVAIRLTDLNKTVTVSVVDGLAETTAPPEVWMRSDSLGFILSNEFGFDTLTVNGRFEATPEGFSKAVRTFGVGSLNAMGVAFDWSLLVRGRVLLSLLGILARVVGQLRRARAKPSPAAIS